MSVPPAPSFAHLRALTDAGGLHEHARGTRPRPEHGYCVDDVARGLLVTVREPDPSPDVHTLRAQYLDFVLAAQAPDGAFHNRRGTDPGWRDEPSVDDCWGRALWGLGAVVGARPEAAVEAHQATTALAAFERGAALRSEHARAETFAALGAAGVLHAHPDHPLARRLLGDVAERLATNRCETSVSRNGWAWPEPRLSYANGCVPEVLLSAGDRLDRPDLLARGLELLDWLLAVQTLDGHLSVVPVGGRGPGETGPGFDQQPIEVAALADACALAHDLTGEARWAGAVRLAAGWFTGDNDTRTALIDPVSGGGCDGLEPDGRNENQGAESTLALVSTLQQAARLRAPARGSRRPAGPDSAGMTEPLRRTSTVLHADASRVIARLFVPGSELSAESPSRAGGVMGRVLALPEAEVAVLAADVRARWGPRHRDLDGILRRSYAYVAPHVPDEPSVSDDRRTLLGAYFTQEQSIEAAALFNPSLVAHPDQDGVPDGSVRVVMSLRGVGEGHVSCIELRTGTVDASGELTLDDPGPHVEAGTVSRGTYSRPLFAHGLTAAGVEEEAVARLISQLPATFGTGDLERALTARGGSELARVHGPAIDAVTAALAESTYEVEFPPETTMAERVLRPSGAPESQGLEDARFVRFVDSDGVVGYRATYTAFDGRTIAPHLLQTDDFRRFRASPLAGPAAVDKGMALFPRTVGGRHLALTRSDRETTGVAASPDGFVWSRPTPLMGPESAADLIQTGNCGSPLETPAGWLVITHGVGPMREYTLGALLLDLDDPTTVIGRLQEPLLRPGEDEREGYVPNVVYSCGSLVHGDVLVLPYGCSDAAVKVAVVDLPLLLDRLLPADLRRPPG